MKPFLLFSILIHSVTSFGTIFGKDDRKFNPAVDSPYQAVGKINDCTGVLIDRDLVLTVRHCVLTAGKNEIIKEKWADYIFHPGAYGGSSLDPVRVKHVHWLGTKALWGKDNTDQDWAILELEKPVGEEYGWMQIKPVAYISKEVTGGRPGEEKAHFSMASYSADRGKGGTLSVQEPRNGTGGCSLYAEDFRFNSEHRERSEVLHDCDSAPGSSGAPIYKMEIDPKDGQLKPYIYAMEVGAFSDPGKSGHDGNVPVKPDISEERTFTYANRAAKTTFFYAKYRLLQIDREKEKLNPTFFITDYHNIPANLPEFLYKELNIKPAARNDDGSLFFDPEELYRLGKDPYHEKPK